MQLDLLVRSCDAASRQIDLTSIDVSQLSLDSQRGRQDCDAERKVKVLLIDDHSMFTEGLVRFLCELDANIQCVAAPTIRSATQLTERFDIILLDVHLPDSEGLEGLRRVALHHAGVPITVVSGDQDAALIRRFIDAGAMGFVPKSSSIQVLMAAMRLVLAGGSYLPPHVLNPSSATTQASSGSDESELTQKLTDRQIDVLLRVLQGKPNKVIARELKLAEGTVKSHLSTAFRLLNVSNRTEAVFQASKLGLTLHQ